MADGQVPFPGNPRLWRAFDEGHVEAALRGEGAYFLRSHTWGDHDLLLVLGELDDWSVARGANERASTGIRNAFQEELDRSVGSAYQFVWTVAVLEQARGRQGPVSAKELASLLPPAMPTDDRETLGVAGLLAENGYFD